MICYCSINKKNVVKLSYLDIDIPVPMSLSSAISNSQKLDEVVETHLQAVHNRSIYHCIGTPGDTLVFLVTVKRHIGSFILT